MLLFAWTDNSCSIVSRAILSATALSPQSLPKQASLNGYDGNSSVVINEGLLLRCFSPDFVPVVALVVSSLNYDIILGMDFLQSNHAVLDFASNLLRISGSTFSLDNDKHWTHVRDEDHSTASTDMLVDHDEILLARLEMKHPQSIEVKHPAPSGNHWYSSLPPALVKLIAKYVQKTSRTRFHHGYFSSDQA